MYDFYRPLTLTMGFEDKLFLFINLLYLESKSLTSSRLFLFVRLKKISKKIKYLERFFELIYMLLQSYL